MKFIVVAVIVGLACGTEAGGIRRLRITRATSDQEVPIVRSESDVKADSFNYVYETGNGILGEASGALTKAGAGEAISVKGHYRYNAPDGTPVDITYTADENGYQPTGDSIPVPPPIPEAILRSLEYIKAHPAPVDTYKKQ